MNLVLWLENCFWSMQDSPQSKVIDVMEFALVRQYYKAPKMNWEREMYKKTTRKSKIRHNSVFAITGKIIRKQSKINRRGIGFHLNYSNDFNTQWRSYITQVHGTAGHHVPTHSSTCSCCFCYCVFITAGKLNLRGYCWKLN